MPNREVFMSNLLDRVLSTALNASYKTGARFQVDTFTWHDLYTLWKAGKLQLVPSYQRGLVAPLPWRRRVVACVMQQLLPVIIYMRILPDGRFQVLDGLQRISTMMMYFDGELRTPTQFPRGINFCIDRGAVTYTASEVGNKSFHELETADSTKSFARDLKSEPVISILYDKMSDHQATELFCLLNDNTDMNPAEKNNAILGRITELFRRWARGITPEGVEDRSLRLPLLDLIGLKAGRMVHDDLVARLLLMEAWHLDPNNTYTEGIYHNSFDTEGIANFARGKVSGLLNDVGGKEDLEKIEKETMRRCGVICKWIIDSGTATKHINTKSLGDVVTLYQLTHALEVKFGGDYKTTPAFAVHLFRTIQNLCNKDLYPSVFTGQKTPYQSMKESTKSELNKIKIKYVLDALGDAPVGLTSLDPKRTFTRDEIYAGLAKQNFTCAVTGLPLNFDDAQGGHTIAHSKGGRTVPENLIVLHKEENRKMGAKSFVEYMASRTPLFTDRTDLNPAEKVSVSVVTGHKYFLETVA